MAKRKINAQNANDPKLLFSVSFFIIYFLSSFDLKYQERQGTFCPGLSYIRFALMTVIGFYLLSQRIFP